MKIVADTNVVVSGFLFHGPPRELLLRIQRGLVFNATSPALLAELEDVLARPKFGVSTAVLNLFLAECEATFEVVSPVKQVRVIEDDPDDDRVLEAALTAKASTIVSGDRHLLQLKRWNDISILSPSEFLSDMHNL